MQQILPADEKRKTLDKAMAETNPEWGCSPKDRPTEVLLDTGVVVLDKSANPTSHEVVAWLKRILRLKKAGHGGTLDPQVTGLLPIALGRSTKAVQVLLPAGKEYVCVLKLHQPVSEERIRRTMNDFVGEIYQRPPVRSSVKRRLRIRRIYYIQILEILDNLILFRVGSQAGTYIRKLCNDIGLVLGVKGHMQELRRTRTGPFSEKDLVTLQDVVDAAYYYFEEDDDRGLREVIQPIEQCFTHLPFVTIRDSAVDAICNGAGVTVPGVTQISSGINEGTVVLVKTLKGEAVALGNAFMSTREILEANSGICVKPFRVVMPTGTYPRLW